MNVLPSVFFSIFRVFLAVSSEAFAVRSAALPAAAMPQVVMRGCGGHDGEIEKGRERNGEDER